MPNTVTKLDDRCFSLITKFKNIDYVRLSDNLEFIGEMVFENCNISDFVSPEKLKKICFGAFKNCKKLKSICLKNLNYLGDYSFYDCDLENVTLSQNLDYIGDYSLFCDSSIKNIIIPEGIKEINGYFVFNNLNSDLILDLPKTLNEIRTKTFIYNKVKFNSLVKVYDERILKYTFNNEIVDFACL